MGAVAAAAADEGEGGAKDGSGMYEVYVPKLLRVSRALLWSARAAAAGGLGARRWRAWREALSVLFRRNARVLTFRAGGKPASGPRGRDAHAGCGAPPRAPPGTLARLAALHRRDVTLVFCAFSVTHATPRPHR